MVRWYLPAKMKIMDIMVVNPEIRAEKRSNFRVSYNFPWDCVLRYTEDSSTTDPEPQPTTGNAKIRKGQSYANKFANAGIPLPEKETLLLKKQGLKFFRQL